LIGFEMLIKYQSSERLFLDADENSGAVCPWEASSYFKQHQSQKWLVSDLIKLIGIDHCFDLMQCSNF